MIFWSKKINKTKFWNVIFMENDVFIDITLIASSNLPWFTWYNVLEAISCPQSWICCYFTRLCFTRRENLQTEKKHSWELYFCVILFALITNAYEYTTSQTVVITHYVAVRCRYLPNIRIWDCLWSYFSSFWYSLQIYQQESGCLAVVQYLSFRTLTDRI